MSQITVLVVWLTSRNADGDRGASLVEYALLLALIAVVCIVAVASLGGNLDSSYTDNGSSLFPPN